MSIYGYIRSYLIRRKAEKAVKRLTKQIASRRNVTTTRVFDGDWSNEVFYLDYAQNNKQPMPMKAFISGRK